MSNSHKNRIYIYIHIYIRWLQLYVLGATDLSNTLTPLGKRMAMLPLEPLYAKLLISSADFGCSEEVCYVYIYICMYVYIYIYIYICIAGTDDCCNHVFRVGFLIYKYKHTYTHTYIVCRH